MTNFQLSNGLQVILAPVEGVEATCVLLYHLTGVRDDPAAIRGASYLYRNLMARGTQHLDSYDRLLFIQRNGGISDRIVNFDFSFFYQVVPASEIDNALWLESERISSLKLSEREINYEKNNTYTRYYRSANFNPHVKAVDWMWNRLFGGTLYATPIYGNLQEIRGFNDLAVKKVYRNFKDLSRVVMVITGKFNREELKKLIMKHFGGLDSPARGPKPKYTPVTPRPEKYVYENWMPENLSQPFTLFGIRAPSKFAYYDYIYFDFIRCYLLDPRISKLEEILNRRNKLDISISHDFTDHFEANGLVIKLTAPKRVNLEKAKYYVNRVLDSLSKSRTALLSNADLKTAKTLMEIDFLSQMAQLDRLALFLAENYHLSGKLDTRQEYLRSIRKINSYDVYRIARNYLNKKNRVNLNVYPKKD